MDIQLNGDRFVLPDPATISDLLRAQGLAERRVAVEVNGEIVPRGRHDAHALRDGDRVEIVHALGGG
ncbi:sulfur carrier protein ThiS [Luteimonas sp. R10]|uniref:sulfur carrier protein ThiS n=1 Tax=Luteimonas sp. R10 TaxID=3108176 RepID=UPI00308DE858|nr:sulfur carrier protein ThiS [Luteimonas sp. R10]